MLSVNHVTISGKVTSLPRRIKSEEFDSDLLIFTINNSLIGGGGIKSSCSIDIRCVGNVAEYVDACIGVNDKVIVSGIIGSSRRPNGAYFINIPHIKAMSVCKLEQEQYK